MHEVHQKIFANIQVNYTSRLFTLFYVPFSRWLGP